MNLFDPDSKIIQFFQTLGGLIVLNLCFVVCCIPIVTVGAACTAMYTVTLQEADDRSGSILSRFFRAFGANFGRATGLWLLLLLLGGTLGYNYLFLTANPTLDEGVFRGLLIALSIIYTMICTYAFPLLSRFDNTVMGTLRNSLALAIGHLPKTVLMAFLNLLPALILVLSESLFLRLSIFLVMIYFAAAAQLNSLILIKIFRRFTEEQT